MDFQPWHYFLTIERDFIKTLDFVEFHPDNDNTYSNEFAKLMLLIGSEVDVVAKMVCKCVNPKRDPQNIESYREIICGRYHKLHTMKIEVTRYARNIKPWLSWGTSTPESPEWWKAYNKVKHQRDQHFSKASLKNTSDALCGLLVLLLYYYKGEEHLQPYPDLFNDRFPDILVMGRTRHLPDD